MAKKQQEIDTRSKSGRKRFLKLGVIAIVLLLCAASAFAGWMYYQNKSSVEIVTDIVRRGTVEQTVEATGELESVQAVDLSFDTSGTVNDVFFVVGDQVEAGDVIAQLKSDELDAEIQQAEKVVSAAQARLDLEIAGASNERVNTYLADVAVAESALEAAKVELERAVKVSASDIRSAEVALTTANDALANTRLSNEQSITLAKQDFVSTMKSNMVAVRSALSEADEILGVENTLANDNFENVLSHQDPTQLSSANLYYKSAIIKRDAAESIVFALSFTSSDEDIEMAAESVEDAINHVQDVLLYTRRALDATTLEYTGFTLTDLAALKTSIDTERSSIQAEETAFIIDRNAITSTAITAETNEDTARNAVLKAQQDLNKALLNEGTSVATAQAAVSSREADVLRVKAALAELQADPRFVDLAGFIADVEKAEAALDAVEARAARSQIRSPIGGRVTSISVEVGEQVLAANPVVTIQTTDDAFRVVARISESDIAKVMLEDQVDVTFDAFGDDAVFSATIQRIDPAESQVEGVVFYEVEVYMSEVVPGFRPGLSADIIVKTDERTEILYIPRRAILEEDGVKYVRVPVSGDDFEKRTIEQGLRGDDGRIEIISGLEEGEEVIISIIE